LAILLVQPVCLGSESCATGAEVDDALGDVLRK
jgi:hypothetical protein